MTTTDHPINPSAIDASQPEVAAVVVQASVQPPDFETFCRSRYPVIARSLVLALNSVELGGEAADEAFAIAWERWDTVSQMTNPSGWVFRVGLNWGRSFIRRVRREVPWSDVKVSERIVEAPTSDPTLVRALAKLGTDHRTVLVARYYLDWSEAEIASALNIPAGTVKSRLSRALEKLNNTWGGNTR